MSGLKWELRGRHGHRGGTQDVGVGYEPKIERSAGSPRTIARSSRSLEAGSHPSQVPPRSAGGPCRTGQVKKRGLLVVVSAGSGAGKSTLCRMLLKRRKNLVFSISATTRLPSPGENDGKDYYF